MSDNPPCMLCNHSPGDHPIVGYGGSQSPCTQCDCPGYIAHRAEHYRALEPTAEERSTSAWTPEGMELVLRAEDRALRTDPYKGEINGIGTLFEQYDEHPYYGDQGEIMLRGVEPGEVPKSMRNMMRVTRGGNVAMKYGRDHRRDS